MHSLNAQESASVADAVAKDPKKGDPENIGHLVRQVTGRDIASPQDIEKIENQALKYKQALNALDSMKQGLGPLTVGLGGKVGRVLEPLGNVLFDMPDTQRKDFQRDMATVQEMAKNLISVGGAAGSAAKNDPNIATIVAGGAFGDTVQNVTSAINKLQTLYKEDIQQLDAQHMRFTNGQHVPSLQEYFNNPAAPQAAPSVAAIPEGATVTQNGIKYRKQGGQMVPVTQ
jgi:hypothetical protein